MAGGPIRLPIVSKFDNRGVKNAVDAVGKFAKNTAIAMGAATAAVGAFGIASVRSFASFDAEMTKSLAIMGDVSQVMRDEMAVTAREVAKATTFSADQAAESFFFLASAGLDAQASISAMPQVARFAQAGMFDMALATDLLTDAQSALGLTIRDDAVKNLENLTRVSDVLVKANTLANASVEQFSKALTTKAGASLRAVGKDVEEGVAVLAAFADQGIKAELAGTQLGIVMRDLSTKAIDNKDKFRRFGIEVFDSSGEMNNMADIVGDLEGALAGMSDETAKATLLQLGFSDKSLASLMALMGTSEAIREYERELRNAGGTTETIADKQLLTFNAQLELLKSRFNDIMLSVGEGLTPTLMTFVENMGPLLDELGPALIGMFEELGPVLTDIFEELPGFIEALTPLIPVIGDIALLVLSIAEAIMPVLSGVIEGFSPILEGFTGAMAENGEVLGALIIATGLFVIALRAVSTMLMVFTGASAVAGGAGGAGGLFAVIKAHPFVAFIAAIGATIFSLNHFYTATETGKEFVKSFVSSTIILALEMQNAFAEAMNKSARNVEKFVNFFVEGAETIIKGLSAISGQEIRVDLPKLRFDRMEIIGEDEIKRRAGTLFDDMKFTPRNFTGGPGSFMADDTARMLLRAGGTGASPFDLGTFRTPMDPSAFASFATGRNFQFEQGVSGFPALGTQAVSTDNRQYVFNIDSGLMGDPDAISQQVMDVLIRYEQTSGPVFARYTG